MASLAVTVGAKGAIEIGFSQKPSLFIFLSVSEVIDIIEKVAYFLFMNSGNID